MTCSTTLPERPLADPPRFETWPVALRSAGRLRGYLVACGPGLRGIGWPETSEVRGAALAYAVGNGIATHRTAAWAWGAARHPGAPLRANAPVGRRRPVGITGGVRFSERHYDTDELVRIGPILVSSPRRTILDLLFDRERFGIAEHVACRLLSLHVDGGLTGIEAAVRAHRRPYQRHALGRLSSILGSSTQ